MQQIDGRAIYAASDLNNYLECKRLTELDALVARKQLERPNDEDEQAALIKRKGDEHEQRYLEHMRGRHGDGVVSFERSHAGADAYHEAEWRTREAMASGARIIYQATFFDGQFIGHADFLRRVEVPSELGAWSYEVIDTKLALSTKPYFLIQLCNYSEHLERLQGRMPDYGYIVLGSGDEQRFRLHDYFAYYRHLKAGFLAFLADPQRAAANDASEYPFECKHCGICPWDTSCEQKRIDDDHLSIVAWMRRDQIAKFEGAGITTLAGLASASNGQRPKGMSEETFAKLRRQASLQLAGRERGPIYEVLPNEAPLGFGLLPTPAPGDVYFDMEGDPLFEPGRGLEYLFGCWIRDDDPPFRAFWGLNHADEKRAFEAFVDFIMERRNRYPTMHVYHYASYEKSALRRLAQQHCTREDAVDDLLRGEVLVDLFAVVRQALAISEDGYGLKKLERFYDLKRTTDVKKGDESIVMFERWLLEADQKILDDIESYNKDDCRSTHLLHQWLLARREEAIAMGCSLPFRAVQSPTEPCHPVPVEGCKKCAKRVAEEREAARTSDLERELLAGVLTPESEEEYHLMSPERRMRYLLGHLLAYHRREDNPAWWQYFDRCENVDELREFDREAIGGLRLLEDRTPYKLNPKDKNLVYAYTFDDQHHKMGPGDAHDPRTISSAGLVVDVNDRENVLLLKRGGTLEAARAIQELIPPGPPPSGVQRAALVRIANAFRDGNLERDRPATFDLLAGRAPRITTKGTTTLQPAQVDAPSVSAIVQSLDHSYLFVQGPPGSGKSTVGSQIIADLLERGLRVGVTSTGHKAIHHLLHKVEDVMHTRGKSFRGVYKHSDSAGSEYKSALSDAFIESVADNKDVDGALTDPHCLLAGGTAWLFARPEFDGAFDYLFIDEAGQVSLADSLALSQCANNVVLLGDPSQLAQVGQGRHPLHVDDSVLQHLLGDDHTIPRHRGVFLDFSYRMQPQICSFISDAMYDGRLQPAEATHLHKVTVGAQDLCGLWYLPVEHGGNSASSEEEADRIVSSIARLLEGSVTDSQPQAQGVARPMTPADIIVVTPYNAQRRLIERKLREAKIDVKVGTVDKFQGQEAAVVFYSMATSSGDDIPRNVGFLFEKNRFNVAISRARALTVLCCSPRLLDTPCNSPDEMALVNLLCAFAETAQTGEVSA